MGNFSSVIFVCWRGFLCLRGLNKFEQLEDSLISLYSVFFEVSSLVVCGESLFDCMIFDGGKRGVLSFFVNGKLYIFGGEILTTIELCLSYFPVI